MKPILVLQMQRMGDIILSFPLLGALQKMNPANPIWTVAEPHFFTDLLQFSPQTTFFPPEAAPQLQHVEFQTVINLSHREDAARLAGSLRAEHYYGAHSTADYSAIDGDWALYRASIVHNNRYNLFHWSDLQILDHSTTPLSIMASGTKTSGNKAKIGIFMGASEQEKRPTPQFFANLAKILVRKHYQPIFLGGPNDVQLGNEAEQLSGIKHASLCGQLSLAQFAHVLRELSLFITPDTGPMHLATWLKTPTLNISVGPVNPWETGPTFANHHIIQPNLACTGCWQACQRTPCQQKLHAGRVALIAQCILEDQKRLANLEINDMRIYRTGRDQRGLYKLIPINQSFESPRHLMACFWQDWFWHKFNKGPVPHTSFEKLNIYPHIVHGLRTAIINLGHELQKHLKNVYKGKESKLSQDFWQKLPKPIRPFTSHIHLFLQNKNYSREAWDEVLQSIEALSDVLRQ